jgi:hypothetical protein
MARLKEKYHAEIAPKLAKDLAAEKYDGSSSY